MLKGEKFKMKVTLYGKEYKIKFQHSVGAGLTYCWIFNDNTATFTYAILHPKDQYNRKTGRKVALNKALKELFPNDKQARKHFWEEYFKWIGGIK